jgi:mono/diheme cytochrome c family protein
MRAAAIAGALVLALPALAGAQAPAAGGSGKQLYDKYCSQCHGETGDGKGPAAQHLLPKPRDFTTGKFKIRTTPNGALPTDGDIEKIIRRGMPYTSMPAWPQLTDQQVQELVAHVKSFYEGFKNPEQAPKPITFPAAPPAAAAADVKAKGQEIYTRLGCAGCHGEQGRTDGATAPMLKEDLGHPIRPADLTQPWTFRGGATREDIFRTLSTGLNGTPMPSYQEALKDDERWLLTDYILSLADGGAAPNYSTLLVAAPVDDVDLAKGAALFAQAPASRFPVVGQIMEPGRAFYPGTVSVLVQAVVDAQRIAFRVRWNDIRADQSGQNGPDLAVPKEEEAGGTPPGAAAPAPSDDPFADELAAEPAAPTEADIWGDDAGTADATAAGGAEFSDAVAIQLPVSLPGGVTKPYFIFGDGSNPVDLWFLDVAKNRARQYVGRGSAALTLLEGSEVEGTATFDKGEWSAVFVRDLRSTNGVTFQEDQFVPIAFSLWDGTNRERGNRRGLTQWAYVYVPPRERPSPYGAMAGAAAGVVVLEAFVVGAMVRRRRRRTPPAQQEQ